MSLINCWEVPFDKRVTATAMARISTTIVMPCRVMKGRLPHIMFSTSGQ